MSQGLVCLDDRWRWSGTPSDKTHWAVQCSPISSRDKKGWEGQRSLLGNALNEKKDPTRITNCLKRPELS